MTSINSQGASEFGLTDRLSFKLAALFFGTFLLVFVAFLIYDVFIWSAETQLLEMSLPTQAVVVDIDPKIESELAKVLTLDDQTDNLAVRDPFSDKTGVSGIDRTSTGQIRSRPTAAAQETTDTNSPVKNPGSQANSAEQVSTGQGSDNPTAPPKLSTKDRLLKWEKEAKFGAIGDPDSTLFAIDDLIPVGVVDGGNGQEEVMFFSLAADRTLSFRVGTHFNDGLLFEIRSDGVVFRVGDKEFTTKLKSWGRSIRSGSSRLVSSTVLMEEPLIEKPISDEPVVTGGSN